jgi:hypothetical protein
VHHSAGKGCGGVSEEHDKLEPSGKQMKNKDPALANGGCHRLGVLQDARSHLPPWVPPATWAKNDSTQQLTLMEALVWLHARRGKVGRPRKQRGGHGSRKRRRGLFDQRKNRLYRGAGPEPVTCSAQRASGLSQEHED